MNCIIAIMECKGNVVIPHDDSKMMQRFFFLLEVPTDYSRETIPTSNVTSFLQSIDNR
jgi:hypothetical protein